MSTNTKEINELNKNESTVKVSKKEKQTAITKSTKRISKAVKSSTDTKKTPTVPKKVSSSKKNSTTKKSTKTTIKPTVEVVEYYDLPYRYNETVVKILYQTPDTLFVYWDISDKDRENYIKEYGENFFNVTRPVLIIHNDTMNYSFEVPINDFANSWYLHVNDSKCNYRIELGRRQNYKETTEIIQENVHNNDYIYISTSNEIESPNNHVLFSTNENNTIKFRNIKNNNECTVSLYDVVNKLPGMKNSKDIPYISKQLLKNMYSSIYQNEDLTFIDKISNPSSGNPSSGSMPLSR